MTVMDPWSVLADSSMFPKNEKGFLDMSIYNDTQLDEASEEVEQLLATLKSVGLKLEDDSYCFCGGVIRDPEHRMHCEACANARAVLEEFAGK